jgi:Na+/H+-dicarboxylate symporter
LGVVIHNTISAEAALSFSNKVKILATVFIRLVQMIIAPLVLQHVGIAKLGNVSAVGRIGERL